MIHTLSHKLHYLETLLHRLLYIPPRNFSLSHLSVSHCHLLSLATSLCISSNPVYSNISVLLCSIVTKSCPIHGY